MMGVGIVFLYSLQVWIVVRLFQLGEIFGSNWITLWCSFFKKIFCNSCSNV